MPAAWAQSIGCSACPPCATKAPASVALTRAKSEFSLIHPDGAGMRRYSGRMLCGCQRFTTARNAPRCCLTDIYIAVTSAANAWVILFRRRLGSTLEAAMRSAIHIVAICSIGAFLFRIVHRHECDDRAALVMKLAILALGFTAILDPLLLLILGR